MNDSWETMIKSDLSSVLFSFLQLKYSTFKRSVSQDSGEDEPTQKSKYQALLAITGDWLAMKKHV